MVLIGEALYLILRLKLKIMKKTGVFSIIILLIFGVNINLIAQYQLTGSVNYNSNDTLPIPQVTLGLYDMSDDLVVSTVTDDDGVYFFDSIPSGAYYLRSTTNLDPDLVDLQDAHMVLMYLLNWIDFDDIQYEAADINNSGTVTWSDYFYIVINYMLYGQPFPAGDWQFEEAYVDFTSRENPPDTTKLWGISEGDVEGIWEPSGRDLNIFDFSHYPVQVASNEMQLEIKSNVSTEIAGFNINLAYPKDQINVLDVSGPDNNLKYVIDEENGIIKAIWLDENASRRVSGDKLITLTVEAKDSNFEIGSFEPLPGSLIMDTKGGEIENVEIQFPMLEKTMEFEIEVSTYPNPVQNELHVKLNLNENTSASIVIFDANGKLISTTDNIALNKGEQLFTVDTQSLNPGFYFYVVELNGATHFKTTGRIVKSL